MINNFKLKLKLKDPKCRFQSCLNYILNSQMWAGRNEKMSLPIMGTSMDDDLTIKMFVIVYYDET